MRYSLPETALHAAAAVCVLIASLTGAHAEETAQVVTVIDGFQSPESVLLVGDRRFVSNVGPALDPLTKDGDGFISELSATGDLIARRAFPPAGETLDAPKGMAATGGRIYVTDIDRVIGFDLNSGARVFEQALPGDGPAMANDLIATPNGDLLVSDTLRHTVYRIDPSLSSIREVATGIDGANGFAFDAANERYIVVALGEGFHGGDIFALPLGEDGQPVRLTHSPHGIFDGVAVLPDGHLIVSDWKETGAAEQRPGAMLILSADGVILNELQPGQDIPAPADFAYDQAADMLWIPAMTENQVMVVSLAQ